MTIVFAMPANSYSSEFFNCWIKLTAYCNQNDINMIISQKSGSNIHQVREMTLGTSFKPGGGHNITEVFDGKFDYDYIMFIDSDIIFDPEIHFKKLIEWDLPIISGIYKRTPKYYCFLPKTKILEHPTDENMDKFRNKDGLINTFHCGLGWTLIKKEVFDKVKPPYFLAAETEINGQRIAASEDASFFWKLRLHGFDVLVDPSIHVAHQKLLLL